jgi:sulfatase maturation enzyme AslB (radical SAM superfamily)
MANILLTSKCTRSCPYCFAEKEMAGSTGERMSWENLIYITDFLQASGEKSISLLGGEPTLHANFVDYVLYLIERNFNICVFTNGIMSEQRLDEIKEHLTSLPFDRLTFVCNLNNPEQTPAPPEHTRKIDEFLSFMGPWAQPGFNIYRLDFDLEFIFDFVNRYGMKRSLRIGITHPVPGTNGMHIKPHEIKTVINRLCSFKPLFDKFRVKPGPDCGFPICKFDDEQLGWLHRLSGSDFKFGCGPAIDITPDMSVYACFPLSKIHRKSIYEFDTIQQVGEFYSKMLEQIRVEIPGIYAECDGCIHRIEGACSGGGACQLFNRFMGEAVIRLPEIESEIKKTHLPA